MSIAVERVRVGRRDDSESIPDARPVLSWTISSETSGWLQAFAELELDGTHAVRVEGGDSVQVPWPFPDLLPREEHTLRIRVAGEDGALSPWSEAVVFRASFLAPGEWQAPFIGTGTGDPALLRTEFDVATGLVRATLYATAHGVYDARINGSEVDDELFRPGWTPYRSRLVHETTDVTALLVPGRNALGASLGGGWYTERVFAEEGSHLYGAQTAFAAQLLLEYADGTSAVVQTGRDWRATTAGPILASSIYDGERYDARRAAPGWDRVGFDDSSWATPSAVPQEVVPSARISPAVRRTEELPVAARLLSRSGAEILDFGQNLVGRLHLHVVGEAGTVLRIQHAEVLENGELGIRPLRSAKAEDEYVLAGGEEEWEPQFTFHGFRYAQITASSPVQRLDVRAVVIHSDMRRTGWFESSHPLLNQLHENVVWGMRGNFLSLPTDCPQRDERLGWTGDIQVFAPTASALFDTDAFLASWLTDLALEQLPDGSVPFIIPNILWDALTPAAAWGDAATVVPSVVYERFADEEVLRSQFPSMKAWADRLLAIAGDRMLWEGGFQFGDWLDPAAPPEDPFQARTDHDLVASAHLCCSVGLVAHAAAVLGLPEASVYAAHAERARQAFLREYVTPAGRLMSDTQTAYAVAIGFGLYADAPARQRMGDRLAELVRRDDYRIATGFVGTPLVADALSDTGHDRVAARLLLQEQVPSWLYPVTMGATTIWERWDSMLPDGSINPGEMTSFNHYALGAVADWMHRRLAGLAPAAPGYRSIRIAPHPLPGIDRAQMRIDTPYGPAEAGWFRAGAEITVHAVIPANTTAEVELFGEVLRVGSGTHSWTVADTSAPLELTLGTDTGSVRDDPAWFALVREAIAEINPEYARRFDQRTRWASDLPLRQALLAYPAEVREAVERALLA